MTAVIARGVGMLLHIPALMALVSLLLCIPQKDRASAIGFAVTGVAGLAVGQLLYRVFREAKIVSGSQTLIIAAVGWISVALCGALPFWIGALFYPVPATGSLQVMLDPLNALFEGVSGFITLWVFNHLRFAGATESGR